MGKQENAVERHLRSKVEALGGFTRKWTSPGRTGVEDQICFFPEAEIWFIEVKVMGKLPTGSQWREIIDQRMLGHNAGYLAGEFEVDVFMASGDRVTWMRLHVMQNVDRAALKYSQFDFVNRGM
jgi:hypothetical protein